MAKKIIKQKGNYKIVVKKELSKDGSSVIMNIKISKSLQELLREATITETTEYMDFVRYKVKSILVNFSLDGANALLFNKELIDSGRLKYATTDKALCLDIPYAWANVVIPRLMRDITNLTAQEQVVFTVKRQQRGG
ncbi:MAG: hypothetical protein J7L43_00150 [Candidatus Aenigmarchaeota archaeon]|nr:hypothetical protein [Candidatus Aenigmarchaeota archaeon]